MEEIFIKWYGPYNLDNAHRYEQSYRNGIYTISRVWGSNEKLLYLGRTERDFVTRMNEHLINWLIDVRGQVKLRFGELQFSEGKSYSRQKLYHVEALLIHWHKPEYNSMCTKYYYGRDKIVVINTGRRGSLQRRVSTADLEWA